MKDPLSAKGLILKLKNENFKPEKRFIAEKQQYVSEGTISVFIRLLSTFTEGADAFAPWSQLKENYIQPVMCTLVQRETSWRANPVWLDSHWIKSQQKASNTCGNSG